MKIYKKTIFTTILFLTCITNTYAACTQEEINEFKKIEDQYTIKYKFNKDTKDYTVTFNVPMVKKYSYLIHEQPNAATLTNATETSFSYSGITPNNYKIDIIGVSETCDITLKTINLKLAKYNEYSNDPLCEDIKEFVLCQETYDKDIDYDTFVSRINTYKKSKEKKENKIEVEEKVENNMYTYIKENLIQIIIITIFIILVIITTIITFKSVRKSRRLE